MRSRFALAALIAALAIVLAAATGAQAGGRDHGQSRDTGETIGEHGNLEMEDDAASWDDDESDADVDESESDGGKDRSGDWSEPPQPPQAENERAEAHPVEQKGDEDEEDKQDHRGAGDDQDRADGEGGKSNPIPEAAPTPDAGPPTAVPVATVPGMPVEPRIIRLIRRNSERSDTREAWTGKDVLASTRTRLVASKSLAETGFDVWQAGLLGVACLGGSALMLRRTRRS